MTRERRIGIWLGGLAAFLAVLWLLSDIMMPFVAGMAVAYFIDPLADRLERAGASRTLATTVIVIGFFVVAGGGLVLLFPLLQGQVVALFALIPDVIDALRAQVQPILAELRADLPPEALDKLRQAAGTYAGDAMQWVTGFLAGLWSGGLALFNTLSLMIITPVVAFYLLRDWDLIVAYVDGLLPRDAAPTIREQVLEIDRTVAGFVRGQATVCLVLAVWYGAGLTVLGLDAGLLVGLGAGLISFIPYIGATVGFLVGVGLAAAQFSEWLQVALVGGVFVIGQVAESYVLTPKLVGDRVGLHPVWIIFALLAGGALFGFTGVLLAVPVAAVIGVLVRFAVARYRVSRLYDGTGGEAP